MNIFKLIFHDFKSYRMISILIILNIVISAFVICFSYGIYQNYNTVIAEGESAEHELEISPTKESDDYKSSITTKMVIDTVKSLSDETLGNIEYFLCEAYLPTSAIEKNLFNFKFSYNNGKFHDDLFTDEEYNSYDKIVSISSAFRKKNSKMISGMGNDTYISKYIGDAKSIDINGEEFKIIDTYCMYILESPITAFNNDTPLVKGLSISFKTDISRSQYDEIKNAVAMNMGNNAEVPELDITPASELFYYRTILMISVLISILAALNFAVLYRFVLEKRIKMLTIFRICGCTKLRMIFTYLLECVIIGLPIFALTLIAFDKFVLPLLSNIFEYIGYAYSPILYLAIFGIYAVSSFVILLIMISVYISRRSITELKARR